MSENTPTPSTPPRPASSGWRRRCGSALHRGIAMALKQIAILPKCAGEQNQYWRVEMACDICGRASCTNSFHSLEEQEIYSAAIDLFDRAREMRAKIEEEQGRAREALEPVTITVEDE